MVFLKVLEGLLSWSLGVLDSPLGPAALASVSCQWEPGRVNFFLQHIADQGTSLQRAYPSDKDPM